MFRGGGNHSTLGSSEVEDFPRCNSTAIDWYIRTPTDPSPVDPKDEVQPELCEEAGATLELANLER